MAKYFLRILVLFQIFIQIAYIRCETAGGRSIQDNNICTSDLKNADTIDLSVETNQGDQNSKNKHDKKDVKSGMLHFKDHHGISNFQKLPGFFKERSNIENTMDSDYNYENEEFTTLKEEIHNNRLVMTMEEVKRHSPRYSGLRRNKPGLKDYHSKLEKESRKLYARRAHEPRFNEEAVVTGETCVGYKADPTTRSTTEQATTDTTLAASTNEKEIMETKTTDCGSYKDQSANTEPGNNEKLIKKERQNNRNERDTKDLKKSKLNFIDRHVIPSKQRLSRIFKERSNIENTMNYDYYDDNEEIPSLRGEIPRLVMKIEEDQRHSPKYSNIRRNKLGPKGYQANLENESRKLYARRAHEPRFNEEPVVTSETCVGYKAASSLRSTTEQATTDTTLAASTTNKDNTKTTNKGNRKTQPTRNGGPGNKEVKILENEELNEYDKYLCGLFADTFVNGVLAKVQRSRKIAKELGFSNESDENCDRCIELKPSKIPDLDPMRASLGKCSKGSDSSQNSSSCPNSMSDFLDLLLLFEIEHENSVYGKIRDDSSFIFTGDYDSSIRKENGLGINDKYHNRDSFSKDTLEKQQLRDENTEEKSDDRVPNRNYFPGKVRNLPHSHLQDSSGFHDSKHSDVVENEVFDAEAETKTSILKTDKDANAKDNAEIKNFMQPEDSFNDEDFTELHEQQHLQSPIRKKYSTNKNGKDKEFNDPQYIADTANSNLYKPAKVRTSNGRSSFREPSDSYEERPDDASAYPSKLTQSEVGQYAESYGLNQAGSSYGNMVHHPRGAEPIKTQSKHNTQRHTAGNAYSRKNNYFSYLPSGDETLGLNEAGRVYSPYDKSNNWEEGEYQLYPNQPKNGAVDPLEVRVLPPTKYHADGLDDRLRMVKRDTEPYDDDLSGFEIPDIEYELY